MVLCSLAGFAVQRFLHVEVALAVGVLVGFIAANFVPLSCSAKGGGLGGTDQGASSRDSLTSDRNSSR